MLYAVCTQCTFLRAFGQRASAAPAPKTCPACGSEMVIQRKAGRFQPTYVSRVSLDLHAVPPLGQGGDTAADRRAAADLPTV